MYWPYSHTLFLYLDANHFDNPVYSYQKPEDSSSLLNNATIRNNLGSHKASNLDRQKLGLMDDDDESCKGSFINTSINK